MEDRARDPDDLLLRSLRRRRGARFRRGVGEQVVDEIGHVDGGVEVGGGRVRVPIGRVRVDDLRIERISLGWVLGSH